jgi:hypothetical protein
MKIGVLVRLDVPRGMTQAEVCAELRRSVEFGQPELQVLYVEPDPPDEPQP